MNKHGVSRKWFTEADVKDFKSGALRKNLKYNQDKVQIKCTVIEICNLFFHYHYSKEIAFYYFREAKLCAKHKRTHEFHLYCWDHIC